MIPEPALLLDSTLRDGEQAPGVALSAAEKAAYVELAETCGIRYIEVGFPSNPLDVEACRAARRSARSARIVALCLLTDESVRLVADVGAHEALLIVPCSTNHIASVYGHSLDELVNAMHESFFSCQKRGLKINVGLEDAGVRDYRVLDTVLQAIAHADSPVDCVTVADTRGQLTPREVVELLCHVRGRLEPKRSVRLAFHAHNDLGLATANTLAALEAPGAVDSVHVTVLGFGERAGNAALEQIAAFLALRTPIVTGIDLSQMRSLASLVEKAFLTPVPDHAPFMGRKVFMHQSGLHQRGLLIDPTSYQFIPPALVGRTLELVLGKHSGGQMRSHLAREAGCSVDRVAALQLALASQSKEDLHRSVVDSLVRLQKAFLGLVEKEAKAALKSEINQ